MKFLSIAMTNFRPFRGIQRFNLETSGDRTVALIFAFNGTGKTTFLNAFTWALYGTMSKDVEEQLRLVNDVVWADTAFGDPVTVAVEVEFEHEGTHFRARRGAEIRKSTSEQGIVSPRLELWATEADGQSAAVGAAQQKLDSVLPQRLARFFFFNGERIEDLSKGKSYAEVKQDIKTLLGLEQVERALQHLPKVDRKLSAELRKHGGDQAAAIQGRIEELEDQLEGLKVEIASSADSVAALTEDHSGVLELLRQHQGAGPLQAERDRARSGLESQRLTLKRLDSDRRYAVATRGFLAFCGGIADRTSEIADGLHERGALPAPVKRDFVESLLEKHLCICGTPLNEGTEAHRHVDLWREKAGLAEVEAAWQRLSGEVAYVRDGRSKLKIDLDEKTLAIGSARAAVSEFEERLTELDSRLADLPMEEVGRLESRRQNLEARIAKANQELGARRDRAVDAEAELNRARGELQHAQVGDELAETARRRLQLVQSVTSSLEEILAIRSEDMRKRLGAKIQEVFAQITVDPMFPVLSEDFELGLFMDSRNGDPLPVPKSTGQNQILSLSFVAAVSQLARETRHERQAEDGLHDDWGTYPVVIDAAFGSLDTSYQRAVTRTLATMAPQMIVLVSKSQGEGTVYSELRPYINALGVMVKHSSSSAGGAEFIDLEGSRYPYIDTNADSNWTEILEVTK